MRMARPAFALDARRFGRRTAVLVDIVEPRAEPTLSDDMRLFAATFAAGFLFVSVLIA